MWTKILRMRTSPIEYLWHTSNFFNTLVIFFGHNTQALTSFCTFVKKKLIWDTRTKKLTLNEACEVSAVDFSSYHRQHFALGSCHSKTRYSGSCGQLHNLRRMAVFTSSFHKNISINWCVYLRIEKVAVMNVGYAKQYLYAWKIFSSRIMLH